MKRKPISKNLLNDDIESGWIVTFADLMSLLLVFFILLYSISSVNLKKFKLAMFSIHSSLGGEMTDIGLLEHVQVPEIDAPKTIEELTGLKEKKDEIVKDIDQFISEKNLGKYIVLQVLEGKITIRIKGRFLFNSGSAKLNERALPILDSIVNVVQDYEDYNVNIKGHTDNVRINTPMFPSNWELSAVRATTVLKYLVSKRVKPVRLTATGYGSLLPLVINDSEKHRARNRRVEFVLEKK